jgi:hypothetical protein
MITKQPIKFDLYEASNCPHELPFVIQGKDNEWRDSKYGAASPFEAIKLARTLDICMTENTRLRVVKRRKELKEFS